MTGAGGVRTAFAVLAAVLVVPNPACAQSEAEIKAAYLYRFAPFVLWPPKAFDAPNSPLIICVQGDDPFGPILERMILGQRVGGHPVLARRLDVVDATAGCHVVFVAGSKHQSQTEALKALHGAGALTVTDGGGGAVRFITRDDRVRFDIDAAEAAEDGLSLSSKLLSLALSVKGRP